MNKTIVLENDIILEGVLTFEANKEYKVHTNGSSSINREFIISNLTGRGMSLFSLPGKYKIDVAGRDFNV